MDKFHIKCFFVLAYTLLDPRNLIYKTFFLCVPWLIYSCMEVSPLESVRSPFSLSSVLLQLMSIITFWTMFRWLLELVLTLLSN